VDKTTIDELAGKLADAVPGDLRDLRRDVESNFRSLLSSSLDKLDLVTREEFDVQRKVLERTREKLDRLERELSRLEAGNGPTVVAASDGDSSGGPGAEGKPGDDTAG
jgi:BMFP domain-containing protein YqiC